MTGALGRGEGAGPGGHPPWEPIPQAAWTVLCHEVHPTPAKPDHDKPEITDPPFHGAPLGGFGAGTFSRTYRGDFARWHLHTGRHTYRSIPACAQAIAVRRGRTCLDAFALGPEPADGSLSSWTFRTRGVRYAALYPLSWFEGDAARGALTWRITQFSPVLPNSYRETSFPVAIFRCHLHNATAEPLSVSMFLSWENLSILAPGMPSEAGLLHRSSPTDESVLWLGRPGAPPRSEDEGSFAIAAAGGSAFQVPLFDAEGSGEELWKYLIAGSGPAPQPGRFHPGWGRAAGAVGVTTELPPGRAREIAFSLAWHFPVFRFGSGRGWFRRHTRFYGRAVGRGDADDPSCRIAVDALQSREKWQREIDLWHTPILSGRPPELARALFNELYILADGGCAWENGEVQDNESRVPAPDIPGSRGVGRFAVLECFTYPYYATLDVRFYGAFPLLFFWPELERQVLLQFSETAAQADPEIRNMVHVREKANRKRAGVLPHDLGSPAEDPWVKVNAYDDIDPNRWRDLGPKFVLLVTRYLSYVGWEDRGFLRGVWPAVRSAMAHLSEQDRDHDGLPEHEGIPDQTFDKWPMQGAGAYTAGLTIAALAAAIEIARWCGDSGAARRYANWRRKAIRTCHKKLWLGDRFRFDTSPLGASIVMAAQLVGEWAAALIGMPAALKPEETRKALETIRDRCALRVHGRLWGLANGAAYGGAEPPVNRHAREVWVGVNYAIASHMVLAGLHDDAMALVAALGRVTYEDRPFAFTTPEAWDSNGDYRGMMYLRPLAVWAVEEALRQSERSPGLEPFLCGEVADE